MSRSLQQALEWVQHGTELCRGAIFGLDESSYRSPTSLPGWSRKHVVAHLAANAEAIGRLLSWAETGQEQRMYASPQQRDADIAAGTLRPGAELTAWFDHSAGELSETMRQLPPPAWQAEVVTAQGRTVPASETPWMRAREVMVHAVDLGVGVGFADLPREFCAALREDITARRQQQGVPDVLGDDAEVTAYLAGRPFSGVTTLDGQPATAPPPWL